MEGRPLPVDDADAESRGFERVLTEWDSELFGVGVHLRTMMRDGWVCSVCDYTQDWAHDFMLASADTHPKGGDVKQAPLVSGAVAEPDAQPPSGDSHA